MGCSNSKTKKKLEEIVDDTGVEILEFAEDVILPATGAIIATTTGSIIHIVANAVIQETINKED